MANSNLESILVETPGNFHDLETTSVLPKNISVFLRGGHLRDKIQLRGSSLQLEKNIHYEGFLAALVGSKQSTPCNYCSANDGPWAVCIAGRDADGDPLEGACAGCHYDGRGLECSFRDFFLRDGSEQASPSFRCSSRGQGSQNGEVSCQTSIQLPSSQNLQSLSPSQQNSTKAIAIANRQEAKRKAARTQRGNIDFKKELSKVNKLRCGNYLMSETGLQIMNDFMNDTFNKIAEEAAVLAIHKKKRTISTREIIAAIHLNFPGPLGQTLEDEGEKAMTRWLEKLRERRRRRSARGE